MNRSVPVALTVEEGKGVVKAAKLKSMLEKAHRFLKRHVKKC